MTADLQSVYNDDNKLHFWSSVKKKPQKDGQEAEINLHRYEVDWQGFRNFVKAVLESGEGRAVEATIQGTKHMATVKDRINTKNTGPLNQKELRVLSKNHSLLVQFALRLKTIERKVLHCRACQQQYWDNNTWPSERVYFHRIAGKIIRSVIETAVGNAVIRAPKSLQVADADGTLQRITFSSGGEEGKAARYRKQLLGEAILTAFQDNIAFEIPADPQKPAYRAQLLTTKRKLNSSSLWAPKWPSVWHGSSNRLSLVWRSWSIMQSNLGQGSSLLIEMTGARPEPSNCCMPSMRRRPDSSRSKRPERSATPTGMLPTIHPTSSVDKQSSPRHSGAVRSERF